jgi:hypothetical protein
MKRVKTVNEALSAVGLYFDGTKHASGYALRDGRLFPRGDRVEPYKPPGEMFLMFAALSSEQEILNFATRFGLLAMPSYRPATAAAAEPGDYAAESLSEWRAAIAQMRLAVALVERETTEPVRVRRRVGHAYDLVVKFNQHLGNTRLEAILTADNPPQFEMRLVPGNLKTFLWIQLLETLTTGNIIRRCIGCGELMLVSQRAGGHRANARSHPDRPSCRVRASQKFRAQAIRLATERRLSPERIARILTDEGWLPAIDALKQIKKWLIRPVSKTGKATKRTRRQ